MAEHATCPALHEEITRIKKRVFEHFCFDEQCANTENPKRVNHRSTTRPLCLTPEYHDNRTVNEAEVVVTFIDSRNCDSIENRYRSSLSVIITCPRIKEEKGTESEKKINVLGYSCDVTKGQRLDLKLSDQDFGRVRFIDMYRDGLKFINGPLSSDQQACYYIPGRSFEIPHYLKELKILRVNVNYGNNDAEKMYYYKTLPSFENVCGGVAILPTYDLMGQIQEMHVNKTINTFHPIRTAFGECREMFTIFGNVTARRDMSKGSTITFKGTRHVSMIYSVLEGVFGEDVMKMCREHHVHNESLDPDNFANGFFNVHMAVVTANIGKMLMVNAGCLLEYVLCNTMGMGNVLLIPRSDTENNIVKIRVLKWERVFELVTKRMERVAESLYPGTGTANIFPNYSRWKDPGAGNITGDNTITISSKGAVIIRFSWEKSTVWKSDLESKIVQACMVFCELVSACC